MPKHVLHDPRLAASILGTIVASLSLGFLSGCGHGISTATTLATSVTTISPSATRITATAMPANPQAGQSVTITATVSSSTTPVGGTVTLTEAGATVGSAAVSSSGVATIVLSSLPVGSDALTVAYAGASGYDPSATTLVVPVGIATTQTALTANVDPATLGQAVEFAATVTSSDPGLSGNVNFWDSGTTLGSAVLDAAGVATLSSSTLASGSHSITAVYAGDSNHGGSTSPVVVETVTAPSITMPLPASTTTTASATPASPQAGQAVTITATVSSSTIPPNGTVTITQGGVTIGTGTLDASGVATITTSSLPTGQDTLTVTYAGNTSFGASSTPLVVQVGAAATQTALTAKVSPQTLGQPVVFTATVTSTDPGLSGTVSFVDGGTAMGSAAVNSGGVATFSTGALAFGSHSITAVYLGDTDHAASTSAAVVETVVQANTTNVLPAQATQVQNYGDSITCGYVALHNDGSGYVYSNEGYAGLLDGYLGETAQNLCRPGDQAADMARLWVYLNAVPAAGASQLYTVMIGTNDANACGVSSACLSNWGLSLEASIAWLGLPAADKVLAENASATGAWTPDLGFGMATSSANASLTFNVRQAVAGRRLYLAYRVFDPGVVTAGTATLTIDGAVVDTLSAQAGTGHTLNTQNSTRDTIFLEAVPLGAVGTHTVTLTNSAGGGFFSVLWAGASTQDYATIPGSPRILLAQVLSSTSGALNSTIGAYNASLATMIGSFTAEGLYITPVLDYGTLDPASDYYDFLHPNTQGHVTVAAAFEGVL